MNCDDVFDILTRGPFPSGHASDGEVEDHLADCGECQRLAEALRPALELLTEAVPVEESRHLPMYCSTPPLERPKWSFGRQARSAPARTTAAKINGAPGWTLNRQNVAPLLAAAALGVLLAGIWNQESRPQRPAMQGPLHGASIGAPSSGAKRGGGEQIAATQAIAYEPGVLQKALNIIASSPAICRKPREASVVKVPVQLVAMANRACCTQCHRSQSDVRIPAGAAAMVARTCVACHENP